MKSSADYIISYFLKEKIVKKFYLETITFYKYNNHDIDGIFQKNSMHLTDTASNF